MREVFIVQNKDICRIKEFLYCCSRVKTVNKVNITTYRYQIRFKLISNEIKEQGISKFEIENLFVVGITTEVENFQAMCNVCCFLIYVLEVLVRFSYF